MSLAKQYGTGVKKRICGYSTAGSDNIEADYESRHINIHTEWKIDSLHEAL